MDDDHDARTIHCGNLYADKMTEEILYELFVQAGPIERVHIPKDNINGTQKNRQYAFVTYKYQVSVPYALSVFSGTKLFNRDLRLNNRNANKNSDSRQTPMEPQPILPNASTAHQFQMQNPFGNAALRGGNTNRNSSMNNMKPPSLMQPQLQFPANAPIDYQQLLAASALLLSSGNGLGANNMGTDNNDTHKHQSKMMHRHENRSHAQNSNYSRDRRNDRRRSRSRSRDRNDWMRNRGRDNKSDRHDRDRGQRGNNYNRRN